MSERKVLNKYYPPDFDPSKIPRAKKPKNQQFKVRMMMPMSVRCNTCGEYLYKGKKFNARKETVTGEEYLNIKIFRFYMKCTRCSAEFTIRTDPQNSDYMAEMNCSRNFELWRENEKIKEEAKKLRAEEEKGDTMKQLENRTLDSKIEMDIIEGLDEIRQLNARNAKIDAESLLKYHNQAYEEMQNKLHEEDEEELKAVTFKSSGGFVKRLIDEDENDGENENPTKKTKIDGPAPSNNGNKQTTSNSNSQVPKPFFNILPIKKSEPPKPTPTIIPIAPKIVVAKKVDKPKTETTPAVSGSLLGLADYGEDSD